jgi:hypothetical protein
MARTITVTSSRAIKRPIEEVRQQSADMAYHAAAQVHAGVRFTILAEDERTCCYRQEVTLLGQRQADELVNTWEPDGTLRSEAVAGTNQGPRALYRFSGGATVTVVYITFEIPALGPKRWLAPLFRFVAQRALRRAFEEDRRDLKSGAYTRYRARTTSASHGAASFAR